MKTRNDASLAIVGNSLAVLVAATHRARLGLRTTVVNPGGGLGGYFAGVHALGQRRDAGMVLYEFSSFREESAWPSLESYDPMRRNDVGRFCGVVRSYIRSQQPVQLISTPQMWVEGQLMPDMLLGNGIASLPRLSAAPAIRQQLAEISGRVRSDAALWHPANKSTWPVDGSAPADWHLQHGELPFNCDTVSRALHGDILHEALFLPYAKQVMNRDARHMSPLYHRLPWLPFYWPETLAAVLDGKDAGLPPTLLSSADGETVAAFCQRLIADVRNNPLITLVEDRLQTMERTASGFRLRLAARGELSTDRLGWALTPGGGLEAAGLQASPPNRERLPVVLGFVTLPESALLAEHSFVHALSDEVGIYRVTNSSACGCPTAPGLVHLAVEGNPHHMRAVHGELADDAAVLHAMCRDLVRMGLIAESHSVVAAELRRFDGALPLPTHEAVRHFITDQTRLKDLYPGIELLGASAAPFVVGLSDQIVQGLQIARRGLEAELDPLAADLAEAGVERAAALSA